VAAALCVYLADPRFADIEHMGIDPTDDPR